MNGIDRIYYTHQGSSDFGMAGSSLGRDPSDWARRLLVPAQLDYATNRPVSTVYWTDDVTAVVIRRVPGDGAVGQKDSALALVGPATRLDVRQALALATDCPVWTDEGWCTGRDIDRIDSGLLPEPLQLWNPSDADTVSSELLWPMVYAFDRNPYSPLLVTAGEYDESTVVDLIRSLVGTGRVLREVRDLSFSTWEGNPVRGAIVPMIQFLPNWSGAAPGGSGSIVRFPYRDANARDAHAYQNWVKDYLSGDQAALRDEPRYATQTAAPIEQRRPDRHAPKAEPPVLPGRPNNSTGHPGYDPPPANHVAAQQTTPLPADPIPPQPPTPGQAMAPPQPSVWRMFLDLPVHPRDAIPVIDEMTRTPSSESERDRIRVALGNPESPFRQHIVHWTGPDQDRALAPLLVMVLREGDWAGRDVTRSVDRLLRAIHGTPRRGRRRTEFIGLGPNASQFVNWLLAVALVLMLLLLSVR